MGLGMKSLTVFCAISAWESWAMLLQNAAAPPPPSSIASWAELAKSISLTTALLIAVVILWRTIGTKDAKYLEMVSGSMELRNAIVKNTEVLKEQNELLESQRAILEQLGEAIAFCRGVQSQSQSVGSTNPPHRRG